MALSVRNLAALRYPSPGMVTDPASTSPSPDMTQILRPGTSLRPLISTD